MKVIYLQDVKNQGKKGEIKEVAHGYALNFLIPRKLVSVADRESLKKIENRAVEQNKKKEKKKAEILHYVQKMQSLVIGLSMKSDKSGKLFASVTSKMIGMRLKKKGFSKIQKSQIRIKDKIKNIGTYTVVVRFDKENEVNIKLIVSSLS